MPDNENPHGSFAPIRKGSRARWLVCGEDYFRAAKEAIDMAQEEIFITGWWFVPTIELIRKENQRTTVEETLTDAVKRGVKIFILVFNSYLKKSGNYIECENLVKRVKSAKGSSNGEIHFLAYPDILAATEEGLDGILWSEHEKMVIVDQSVALQGGIDLCPDRYEEFPKFHIFNEFDVRKRY